MGTRNYLWRFILSVFLCTIMALEGRDATTATPESPVNVSRSTNNSNGTGPAANGSDVSVAEPNTQTAHSLLGTSLSPATMRMVSGEGRMDATPTISTWDRSSPGMPAESSAVSSAFPTTGTGTTAPSTGTESGTASSPPLSSATTSHSSSSSSPEGSSAATPSPQQSSTSSSTEMPSATTLHPSTALVFSSLSSAAGTTSAQFSAGTTETMTQGPSTPVASTSPASGATEAGLSPTLGSSTETWTTELSSTPLTQGQATVEETATSSPMGSPSPSLTTASVASSATIPPEEGESFTTNQGSRTTAEPIAKTSRSLPSTSLATPSTTNLSIPTSVNPSSTGTCSPISLSIQLENVTSTVIQFSWKPQGGTGDSPYTVRLLGKSGERKERILNETSTAFENLLSGHQYQISVDVSTCSENVSTSLTVQTAAEVYNGITRITSEAFKSEYQNKSSKEFKEFENKFIIEITKHLPQKIQELKNDTKIRIVINSIEEGSVIVHFDIVLDVGQNITKTEVSDAFTEALNRSTEFKVDLQNTSVEARNSCQPGLNDCDQNAACTAEGATYSCQCNKGFIDKSPQVPGRVCQQDLPSEQTTPAPPDTNSTDTTGTGQTTPAPPDTNTISTTGTGSTTPAPPDTNSTDTTGAGSTTPAPPDTNSTDTNGTGSTTPAPPDTNTTHTTRFTGSTSNSVFTTTFTSAPCMPVSVEVQNVTEEEIQLSWSSGSKGSFYIISVTDGKEINKTTTKETKTVFKNLLPGHVYTISVAVSSCAENNQTSVTVRTDSASCFKGTEICSAQSTGCSDLKDTICSNNQAFACSVWLKNQTFNNALYNSDSEGYNTMSERIKTAVVDGMRAELKNDHFNIVVLGFRPGSVVADFLSLLPKEEALDVDDVETLLNKVLKNTFGSQTEVAVQSLSVQSPTDNISSWRAAVIVLGVLLGIALVLILLAILFYIYVRRRSGIYFE